VAPSYFGGLNAYMAGLSVLHWINDGLMAVFFMLVGLEIKREFIEGQLATWPQRSPGCRGPWRNDRTGARLHCPQHRSASDAAGWAIPTATNLALALGAPALLGSRVPRSLKIFLAALAILDDLGAVTIVAVFYTDHLAPMWLAGAVGITALLFAVNLLGVIRLPIYCMRRPTMGRYAEVRRACHARRRRAGASDPLRVRERRGSPLLARKHGIQPWAAFLIVPIFGFAKKSCDALKSMHNNVVSLTSLPRQVEKLHRLKRFRWGVRNESPSPALNPRVECVGVAYGSGMDTVDRAT
jgi:NhaA family Na+:H+ antiporter